MIGLKKLLVIAIVFLGLNAEAQCNVQVSANATSGLHTGDTIHFGNHHICFNSYLKYFSNNLDTLYLEDAVTLTILWSDNLVVYLDSGATVMFGGTGNNALKAVYYDSTVSTIDTAAFNIQDIYHCAGLSYDYSLMPTTPGPGCTLIQTSGLNDHPEEMTEAHAFPNPFTGEIKFEVPFEGEIRIYDLSGILILRKQLHKGSNTIDLSHLSDGLYFYQFENGPTKRMVKQ